MKFKKFNDYQSVNEGQKTADATLINRVARETDRNNHSGARIIIAESMNKSDFVNAYKGIQEAIFIIGHLTPGAKELRNQLDNELYSLGKYVYQNIDQLWDAL